MNSPVACWVHERLFSQSDEALNAISTPGLRNATPALSICITIKFRLVRASGPNDRSGSMLSKKDFAGTSEQDRFKISLGYATLIQGLNPYWCAFLFYSFSAVTFSTASVRLGHSTMSAQCPICPNADVAERFMSTRPGSLPWCCSELGALPLPDGGVGGGQGASDSPMALAPSPDLLRKSTPDQVRGRLSPRWGEVEQAASQRSDDLEHAA